ncbi:thiamine pyrophosphate-binding protein [Pseudobutyrivibrio sp.]|uniref:thiamine pyrophosphate-binding protein n=1 Tax=Pseudobutyrivibrio sp. TaxID=2014367 RepID=UPI001D71B403|nr:thiamine pyrophosphate-binding protein [Pseudobutyrivibrio sp.]MBE5910028.1 thiamine pyrophosphate-binding protein [Pseudobutyrivibrio sp.]
MRVVDYIADFLVEKGVTHNFMVTGGGAMQLDDALGHKAEIKNIFNHNEQGCSVAAEAYARVTGKIASVCVTSGPGGTNAITGVMGGWLDSIPMFVLSGQVKRETTLWSVPELNLRQLGDQEFDIINSVSNMTKYAVMITEPAEIAYHLEKAWYLANNGRKGPVWLDIPLDVQGAKIDGLELKHFDAAAEGLEVKVDEVSDEQLKDILDKISKAKAPLIFAGYGVRLSDSAELLLDFAKKLQIPVAVAWNSGDLVAYDNPLYAGSPSREGTRGSSFIVQNCDLLLVLGSKMSIRTITYNKHDFAKNAYKIMVDIDDQELKKPTFIPDMPICTDVNYFLRRMMEMDYTPVETHKDWIKWCRMMVEKYPACLPEYHHNSKDELLNPYVFVDTLFDCMDEKDVLTLGNGSACVMSFSGAKIKQGQRMFTNAGCAAMGYGMPAALGAAIAKQENNGRVVCVDGDGSLMMNVQELATIAHNNLNVKLFVLNNNGYHSIRQTQRNLFKPPLIGLDPETGVSFPEFDKLAEAFRFKYFEVNNEPEVRDTIEKALSEEGPVLINVIVDPNQNFVPKLSSKVMPDGSIVSPSMDDMFPFLPRDEYEGNRYIK